MKQILIGTHNFHKVKEISNLLADLPLEMKSLSDYPHLPSAVEDGNTLEENAIKKAKTYANATGLLTLADDTGLEVEALQGAPGVYSARYAGEQCSYEDNNRKLIQNLANLKDGNRKALFRCVLALYDPKQGFLQTVEGAIEGEILAECVGGNGFGYDPVFYLPELKKTLAEMNLEEKNKVSHRALAVWKAKKILRSLCTES